MSAEGKTALKKEIAERASKAFRFKVNDVPHVWPEPWITGREVLRVAGLAPPENFTLRVKVAGQPPRKVELDEKIDLRAPGVEKFRAIRREQTEGEALSRRPRGRPRRPAG